MTTTRPDALQQVFQHAEAAFRRASTVPPASLPLADRVFRALDEPVGGSQAEGSEPREPVTLPACAHLSDALQSAAALGGPMAELANALHSLSPAFVWERRAGVEPDGTAFYDGHANTVLAGPRGLERRSDVLVGISLIAPNVRYIDHQHPPEELYVVMSPGEWRQEQGPWHEPGPGGVVHNPPGILHAMRSGDAPLFALWFLWTG